jgi:hypothetical protein
VRKGTEEHVDPGVDHEPVAILRRGPANCPEPLRLPVGISEAASDVVRVLQVGAGCAQTPQRSHQLDWLHPVSGFSVNITGTATALAIRAAAATISSAGAPWCTLVILIPERGGNTSTGGGDHREPGRDHGSRRRHVPGVRKQNRGAGALQRSQQVAPTSEVRGRRSCLGKV